MLNCNQFYELLRENGIDFFTGVPDSLLKDICACIAERTEPARHLIAANEGAAVALASGYHLATDKFGLVYMQNSGLGNAVNPLTSLADREVYSLPMLLLIGWRGEPGTKDEPQHLKKGKITPGLLDLLEIPFSVLSSEIDSMNGILNQALDVMRTRNTPYALVVKKGTFDSFQTRGRQQVNEWPLQREEAIRLLLNELPIDAVIISTTGKTSRELFECRKALGQSHERDFLTVGSMGHCSQIALGIALSKPDRQVVCLDGDGAIIMHMGSLGIIGQQQPTNFKHIVINNGAHESVGGQPTVGFGIDIPAIARSSGYREAASTSDHEGLKGDLSKLMKTKGPALLEIKVRLGSRKDLGRPTSSPIENKRAFMNFLKGDG